jgi:hypothetical protein
MPRRQPREPSTENDDAPAAAEEDRRATVPESPAPRHAEAFLYV